MIRTKVKWRSNKPEAKELLLIKETVICWQMTYWIIVLRGCARPLTFFHNLCLKRRVFVLTHYSSPRLFKGESHSWCSKHFSGTPDLFSSPSCSPSRQEINSLSLFSCSNHLLHSSSSLRFAWLSYQPRIQFQIKINLVSIQSLTSANL